MSSSAMLPEFVCHNPFCGSRRKSFSNEKAYAMHVERAPECLHYLRQQQEQQAVAVRLQQETDAAGRHRVAKRNAELLLDIHSTKKAASLRRNFVNDDAGLATHYDPAIAFPDEEDEASAAGIDDWDDDVAISNVARLDMITTDNDVSGIANATTSSADSVGYMDVMPFMYSNDQKWTVSLLKTLDNINAPDYAFPAVLKWARNAHEAGYSFYPTGGVTRPKNINVLFKSIHNAQRMLPSVTRVVVPHGPPVDVVTYEFAPQLLSLLQNKNLMTADNLLIDLNDPLQPYWSPDGRLGEAISGTVYRLAYQRLITNRQRQLFVPIIQWIDRTSVTGNARFSLKPYMFTPAIFKEPFRRTIQAWGYHGFLPKPKTSSAQNKSNKQGDTIRNYHAQLQAVLQSFTLAGPQLCNVYLPIGPSGSMCVDIITCILFVIQDMQEGDTLCGRFGAHGLGIHRHCRSCTVPEAKLDNPIKSCQYVLAADMAQIAQSPNNTLRKQWSQHFLPQNVFDHVPMADPIRGIFGATPVETLHAFRKGMIENVTLLVFDNLTAGQKAALDSLAIRFHRSHRQTYRKAYPATDFSNGITNLTRISASERLGLVFLFVILAQTDEGWTLLDNAFAARKNKITLRDVLNTLESLLCFDAWLNQTQYWKFEDHAASMIEVSKSIRILLDMVQDRIPLKEGKTWKIPKFHEMLHIVDDMERFGASINYCAQRPESLLIPVAKQPGRRAQKRHEGSAYELQAAQRLSYSLLIDSMYTRIWGCPGPLPEDASGIELVNDDNNHDDASAINDVLPIMEYMLEPPAFNATNTTTTPPVSKLTFAGQATYCTLWRPAPGQPLKVYWDTKTHLGLMVQPPALLQYLFATFGPEQVRFGTEYVHGTHIFRCHPCLQSDGPVYDWLSIRYKKTGKNKDTDTKPVRLMAVVIRNVTAQCPEPYVLVVQQTTKKTNNDSVLLIEWEWSPEYTTILPSMIVAPCFVISIKAMKAGDSSKVLEIRQRESWPLLFTTPVELPVPNRKS